MRLFCFLLFHSVHSKFFTEKLIRNSNTLYNSSPSAAKGYRDRGEIIDNMVFFGDKGKFFWDVRLKKIGRVGNYFGMAGKTVWRGCKNMNLALMTPMTPMTPVCYCPPPPEGVVGFQRMGGWVGAAPRWVGGCLAKTSDSKLHFKQVFLPPEMGGAPILRVEATLPSFGCPMLQGSMPCLQTPCIQSTYTPVLLSQTLLKREFGWGQDVSLDGAIYEKSVLFPVRAAGPYANLVMAGGGRTPSSGGSWRIAKVPHRNFGHFFPAHLWQFVAISGNPGWL